MARPLGKRPKKPNRNFPLFPHADGTWKNTQRIDGRRVSFGSWVKDPIGAAAKERYDDYLKSLRTGEPARESDGPLSVRDCLNHFLVDRRGEAGAADGIEARTYQDYKVDLTEFALVVGADRPVAGLAPADFLKAREHWSRGGAASPHTIKRKLGNVRAAFTHAQENGYIDRAPAYGTVFKRTRRKHLRRARRLANEARGLKRFTPDEVAVILAKAPKHKMGKRLLACVYLGLNCGFYAVDCARLRRDHVDLDSARLDMVRQKTENPRAAALWPETVAALRGAMAEMDGVRRREPLKDDAWGELLLLTTRGRPLVHDKVHRTAKGIHKVSHIDSLSQAFRDVLEAAKIKSKDPKTGKWTRRGINFGCLRHTFRTAADSAGDGLRSAVLLTMGHSFPGMDESYLVEVESGRLAKVSEHVRSVLLSKCPSRSRRSGRPARTPSAAASA